MDDSVSTEVIKHKKHLRCTEPSLAQRELFALKMQHQITTADIFHREVDPCFGLETRMQVQEEQMAPTGSRKEHMIL